VSNLKSFIKIYGPPILEAIRALEKLAVNLDDICIMDTIILRDISPEFAREFRGYRAPAQRREPILYQGWVSNYYQSMGVSVPVERCKTLISTSGESLGEYDFFFEWIKKPGVEQMQMLLEKIDETLSGLGCFYTLTMKE
jgi:hypothetical protein